MLRPLNTIPILVLPEAPHHKMNEERLVQYAGDITKEPIPPGALLRDTFTIAEARKLRMSIKLRHTDADPYWKNLSILSPEMRLNKDQVFNILFGFLGNARHRDQPVWYFNFESLVKEFLIERDTPIQQAEEWKTIPCIDVLFDGESGQK